MKTLTDDEIISLWRIICPSMKQHQAMTFESGPYSITVPTYQLRRLVELTLEVHGSPPFKIIENE